MSCRSAWFFPPLGGGGGGDRCLEEGGAGEADLDGTGIGLVEVGKKAAFGVVAAVDFVEEIDALDADGVIAVAQDIRVILEALDVDHGDLDLAGGVVDGDGGFDFGGELFA